MPGRLFSLEIQPSLPPSLARLEDLANDLLYSWNADVRSIFSRLDSALWRQCGHNPKLFLRRLPQQLLDEAVQDRAYMDEFSRVVGAYDAYCQARIRPEFAQLLDPKQDLVAYFCAEFGLHESFPIYSGGLGILAGDHCKAASDLGIPFVAVGLFYKQGYFTQTIDGHGDQHEHYHDNCATDLPISEVMQDGKPLRLSLALPGEQLQLRVWQARAGHIRLFLLDTDLPENSAALRAITHRLYGGDKERRLQQEMVLGIGGVRALAAMGLSPSVWHINEGHAAFQILERCRQQSEQGLAFAEALELVAGATLFTTHTPVPAGHDIFDPELLSRYLSHYCNELGIEFGQLLALGRTFDQDLGFNMTTLALRGSRFHNGVSRIHGGVASSMERGIWPQIAPQENPISHVTNGVHVPTFLAREWASLLDMRCAEWESEMLDPDYWQCIDEIPAHHYWSIHRALKEQMLKEVRQRLVEQFERNGCSHALIQRATALLDDPEQDLLVLGFARRFATYKRATLLFSDPHRLARMLGDAQRPTLIIFAGKAHPNDHPGKQLIKVIHELSLRPEFIGKVLMLEAYDLALARSLVAGVDVWLNTPEYPLEASGTSGQKAGINGAVNLSVLDGWWGEGYQGDNGWAINPRHPEGDNEERNREEADDLLDIIEYEVQPLYFDYDGKGYSKAWVQRSKNAMKSAIPHFNAQRMVMDYVTRFYCAAKHQGAKLGADQGIRAKALAQWKARVRQHWPSVGLELIQALPGKLGHGQPLPLAVRVQLGGLAAEDVRVECLLGTEQELDDFDAGLQRVLLQAGKEAGGAADYSLDLLPERPGLVHYRIRAYPHHPDLSHPFEMGAMIWL
ncbi:alpha-glucan family phosphorylase [Gallaecimonas kandeliae]|uniref:alpha-glucan family phosphorylase n=1 Tax=Gallaecimonas kandeliae TaxID=3029055 RepID=UPI002647AAF0|nr:alpha-glucan family phosphorylase [Gallaecimonas kandeliae]WKE64818.1 alpha-glucan family phosphorylase [Gallaecimonas kandeliae]